jgi:hypothetical protein
LIKVSKRSCDASQISVSTVLEKAKLVSPTDARIGVMQKELKRMTGQEVEPDEDEEEDDEVDDEEHSDDSEYES